MSRKEDMQRLENLVNEEVLTTLSKEELIDLALLYQKMLHEVYEKIDELGEAFGLIGGL